MRRCESRGRSGQRTSENDVWDKIERVEDRLRDKLKTFEKRLEKLEVEGIPMQTCRKCDLLVDLLEQSYHRENEAMQRLENVERGYGEKLARVDFFRQEADRKVEELEHRLSEAADVNLLAAERKKNQKAQQEIVKLKADLANGKRMEADGKLRPLSANRRARSLASDGKRNQKAEQDLVKLKTEVAKVTMKPKVVELGDGGAQFKASNGAVATVYNRNRVKDDMLDWVVVVTFQALHEQDIAGEIKRKIVSKYGGNWEVLIFATPHSLGVEPTDFYMNFCLSKLNFLIHRSSM